MIGISLIIFFTSMVLVIVFLRKRQIQRKLKSVKLNASTQPAPATQSVQISTSGSQPQPQPMVYSIPPSSMVQTVIYPAPSGWKISSLNHSEMIFFLLMFSLKVEWPLHIRPPHNVQITNPLQIILMVQTKFKKISFHKHKLLFLLHIVFLVV